MERLLANCLATWRITSLLVDETGPYDVFTKFRDSIGIEYNEFSRRIPKNEFAKMFNCFWCCSIWVALVLVLAQRRPFWEIFAYSAAAIYLHLVIGEYVG